MTIAFVAMTHAKKAWKPLLCTTSAHHPVRGSSRKDHNASKHRTTLVKGEPMPGIISLAMFSNVSGASSCSSVSYWSEECHSPIQLFGVVEGGTD